MPSWDLKSRCMGLTFQASLGASKADGYQTTGSSGACAGTETE